ncbi:hypothetical protein M444_01560 [Streptomyces sp. Mg1]|nr:hypothetical protein M444_01560 [Streptomyces sp. Mg1]
MTRRQLTHAQWKFIEPYLPIGRATVYGRFRVWRDAGVFTALLEGLIAEGARVGRTDLSLVSVDSTTVRAHHDAAGLRVSKHLMSALEEAAQEQETARQKGAARRNRTDRPSASASGADTSSA